MMTDPTTLYRSTLINLLLRIGEMLDDMVDRGYSPGHVVLGLLESQEILREVRYPESRSWPPSGVTEIWGIPVIWSDQESVLGVLASDDMDYQEACQRVRHAGGLRYEGSLWRDLHQEHPDELASRE